MRLGGLRRRASPPSSPAASASASRWRARSSTGPRVLLLDEPLGALDLKLRQEMQVELKRIQCEVGITFVYVTHDQEEALTMSDRAGRVQRGPDRAGRRARPRSTSTRRASSSPASSASPTCSSATGAASRCGPEKIRLLDDGDAGRRAARRDGHGRGRRLRRAWSRATRSRWTHGGELQVVRQNLETSSAHALEARGRTVRVGWREEQTYAIAHEEEDRMRQLGSRCSSRLARRWASPRCGGDDDSGERRGERRRQGAGGPEGAASVGQGEGQVNLIAWAGYVEDGSTDPKVDWVSDFEKQTGCQVNVKIGNTSDEMVTLMRTGQYDGVSASGDATLRLIAGGDVAPVNTDLVPNYADVFDALKNQPLELGRRPDVRHPARPRREPADVAHGQGQARRPTRGARCSTRSSPYKGKVTAYDNPIYIADAALYLKATQPDLGIDNPYELDDKQFKAAVDLLKTAAQAHRRVLVGLHQGAGRLRAAATRSSARPGR